MQQNSEKNAVKHAETRRTQPTPQERSTWYLRSHLSTSIEELQAEILVLSAKRGISPQRDNYINGAISRLEFAVNAMLEAITLIDQMPVIENIAFLRGRKFEQQEQTRNFTPQDKETDRVMSIHNARTTWPNLY